MYVCVCTSRNELSDAERLCQTACNCPQHQQQPTHTMHARITQHRHHSAPLSMVAVLAAVCAACHVAALAVTAVGLRSARSTAGDGCTTAVYECATSSGMNAEAGSKMWLSSPVRPHSQHAIGAEVSVSQQRSVAAVSVQQRLTGSPSLSAALSPPSPSPFSLPRSPSPSEPHNDRCLFVSLSARHLPPGLDPLGCLLIPSQAGGTGGAVERLIGHTEVQRSAMSPHWQRRIVIDGETRRSGQTIRIALFDAAHVEVEPTLQADSTRGSGRSGGCIDIERPSSAPVSSLLDRLSLLSRLSGSVSRTTGPTASSSSPVGRVELRSEDAIGSAVLPLDDLCHVHRFHVQQRLPLRHTFDADIDRRLQRLNAHLLVTVRPEAESQSAVQSTPLTASPRLLASPVVSWASGPSCAVPFDAAYRLLCRGAEMWKFAYSSSSARPQRRLVFYARHPLSAAQLQLTGESTRAAVDESADGSSAPNPLFPLGLLYWCPPGKRVCDSARCVPLHCITALYERCQTAAFASVLKDRDRRTHRSIRPVGSSSQRHSQPDTVQLQLGFSVVSPQRTLDLVPDNQQVRDVFLAAIHGILMQHERICYEDDREARVEEAKRTEERRRYNERQLEGQVAVSFSLTHLPLPASSPDSVDTQVRVMLSKQVTVDGGEATAVPTDDVRSKLVGSSEWLDVDEVVTFAHIFSLTLPTSSTGSSADLYHLSVVDLSHRTLGTATFSSQLLVHHHIDIPLAMRHTNRSIDGLLTFNRTAANMRITPLTGRDTMKADILDVITLLQAEPTAPVDLPYITLAFLLRGEACDYYHAPAFSVQRTTLQYNHDRQCVQVAGHSLLLTSLVDVHRQLRPASELFDSVCAVHPEKRVNSRRVLVVHTLDSGSFVCEMRSVMAADAWVTGIRQLMNGASEDGGAVARNRSDIEQEQLNWANLDVSAREALLQGDGESGNESEVAGESSRLSSTQLATSGDAAGEESELHVSAPHPTTFLSFSSPLNGLLPLHSAAAEYDEYGSDEDSSTGEYDPYGSELFGAPLLSSVDLADAHLVPRSHRNAARRLSHSSGLHSPFIHSRSPSFSSLQQPGFHLTPPLSSNTQHEDHRDHVDGELLLLQEEEVTPAAPPLLGDGGDIPCAPPFDIPAAPPLGDGSAQSSAAASKLRKLHWDAISGEAEARGTIFESLDTQLDQSTVEAIEKLFAAVAPQSSKQKEDEAAESVVRAVEIIDRRRAQNVTIALRGLKASVADIVRAIVECDMQLLSVERLQQLCACLPDAVEAKQIKAYVGDVERLGAAEQFMHATLTLPRCAVRLQLLLFVATFDDAVSQLSAHCNCVKEACETLRGSDRLAAAMQGVLAVGGLLSGKRAAGFRLSSLDKLHALKSQQQQQHNQFSLLDFIVEREVSRAQTDELIPPRADRLFFDSLDVDKLHSAAKLDWQAVQSDIGTLQEQLRAVRKEMDRADDSRQPPHSHSRSQSQLGSLQQSQQQPAGAAGGGQTAMHRTLKSFLTTAMSAFHRLSALQVSAVDALRVTLAYFAEPDGSPQSLFSAFERFIGNFTASERRYWDKLDKQQRRAAIEMRKQQLTQSRQVGEKRGGGVASEDGQHYSYHEVKRSSQLDASEQAEQCDSSRTLSARRTDAAADEQRDR